jgi:hypothetical protein
MPIASYDHDTPKVGACDSGVRREAMVVSHEQISSCFGPGELPA